MSGNAGFGDSHRITVERNRRGRASFGQAGAHRLEVWRGGKFLKLLHAKNTIMLAALDDQLNVYYRNGTPKAAWYAGLIDNVGYITLANNDTASSHGGWAENQSYSGGVRPTWSPGASSSQAIVNGTAISWPITATVNIRGVFIISDSTLGGTTGVLASTAQFAEGVQTLKSGDVLKDFYTISSSPLS